MKRRVVSIQFKNRNKEFKGKVYDFLLNQEEDNPKSGDIIRLMDNSYNYKFYGTRVKVVDTKIVSENFEDLEEVRYLQSSMEE